MVETYVFSRHHHSHSLARSDITVPIPLFSLVIIIIYASIVMVEEHEEDQDSLFGSPPPSPRISPHRAQSPPLSLPSASICDNERRLSISTDTQNVGTIALPGSLPYSELPINPLALSLNHSVVPRPPAQSQGQPMPTTSQQIQTRKIQPSRPPPAPIPKSSSTKRSKNSRQSSQSPLYNDSPPQSHDPEISLPNPSSLHPPHFLRNQHNLLGKAGLVAGVNPATITHIPGTTPSNPIIVDDEDTPILGRHFLFRDPGNRYVNPSLLSAPTNEDIVSVLIGQKDIFPVLEGILCLLGKGATRQAPTPPPRRQDNPPVKKRKLNRVPAGAIDWDVPYPFQDGEGPDEYRKTWERERGKHLVTQLVKLIKGAARKAATKNYLQKEQARQAAWEKLQQEMMGLEPVIKKDITVNNHYKPQTITYGLAGAEAQKAMSQVFDAVADTSNDLQLPESNATQNVPFPLTNRFASPSQLSFDNLNYQSQFNVWMNFLQTFPVAFDAQSQSQSNTTSSQESTPGLDDFAFTKTMDNNFDFGAVNMEESSSTSNKAAVPDDLEALISSMMDSLSQDVESTRVSSSAKTDVDQQPSLIGDDMIDPSLWGLSVQPSSDAANGNLSISQAVSPVPSISSSGSIDPMTPMSSAWEISVPEIFMGGVSGDGGQGMFRHTLWENFSHGVHQEGSTSGGQWDEGGQITGDSLSRIVPPEGNMMGGGKGKGKEMNPLGFLSADTTPSTRGHDASEAVMSVSSTSTVPAPVAWPNISQSRKEEILRHAREKRMQIQEELDRVKTQLWETTIEQAALVHLLKRYEND